LLKTLVEFYDEENLENVFSLLSMTYDKVLFITFTEDGTDESFDNDNGLKRFIKNRAPDLKTEVLTVEEKSFLGIVKTLSGAINNEDAFDFDLTGGSEMVISAIGYVIARSENPNLSIHQYDISSGNTVFRHPEFETLRREQSAPKMTVPEFVALYGGKVMGTRDELRPDIKNFRDDIIKLFAATKGRSKAWNTFCTLSTEKIFDGDKIILKKEVPDGGKMKVCREVGDALFDEDIIYDIEITKEKSGFYYAFTLNCSKKSLILFEKSGNVLEYYTYLAAMECGAFTDVCLSVEMDFDGIITTDNTDTTNEIDVMASSGHLPVCISCKNRTIINEYLYEISAVSETYCGRYAVPVIVSVDENLPAIKKRAEAMGIVLIHNIKNITYESFKQELKYILKECQTKFR